MHTRIFGVVMAGGTGERFWPLSREQKPKQLLSLTGSEILLKSAVNRLRSFIEPKQILIITSKALAETIKQHLPELPPENIISEPMRRNTAPCLALAASRIEDRHDDPVMVVVPADHLVIDTGRFREVLRAAVLAALEHDAAVTVGIPPTRPETGYGYMQRSELIDTAGREPVYKVLRFIEKPDPASAAIYAAKPDYFWNSGMFIWRLSVFKSLLQKHMPHLHSLLPQMRRALFSQDGEKLLSECYYGLDNISVDHGIMEKADNAFMLAGDFGWDDLGSWPALERIMGKDDTGNCVTGDFLPIDAGNCIIYGGKRLIAALGVEDLVVVDTDDVLLLCHKERAQDIRLLVSRLRERDAGKFL